MKVNGTITDSTGQPVEGVIVAAFDNDFRSEQKLGEKPTARSGRYEIKYSFTDFRRAEKRSADIFVEVRDRAGKSKVRSDVRYNAPDTVIIDFELPEGFFPQAEFTRLVADIKTLTAGAEVAIADFEETSDHGDVGFLSAELGVAADQLVHFILAHRLQRKAKIEPDFFYAVLRSNVLLSFSPTRLHAIRLVIGLDTDPRVLLDEIVLLTEETLSNVIDSAIKRRVVEPSLGKALPGIFKQLAALRPAAQKSDQKRSQQALIDLIGPTLDGEALQTLAKVLANDHLGQLPALVDQVQAALALRSGTVSADTRATLELARP